ncbi:hypothetical protein WR25_21147 [Diploscapter pachys]|uniref:ABC-type xenobiotic transporter n=1 Tax=Diploscapter pachys TaxID=2018661 RepID=A0A2A2L9K2_9BILA|nr:hypothetical protein WR25_21147 [Diploscapter pachys]
MSRLIEDEVRNRQNGVHHGLGDDEIRKYDELQATTAAENDKSEKDEKKPAAKKVSILKLFRYTTSLERIWILVAAVVACFTGAGFPLMSILQGRVTGAFAKYQSVLTNVSLPGNETYTPEDFQHDVMYAVWGYAGMSICYFFSGAITVASFLIISENISNRLRREFVRCILKQDISWFDNNNSGTLAIKLFDDLERVKEGTGDKFGMLFQFTSQFLTGFVVAFTHSWKLTLIMLAMTPLQALAGYGIGKSMSTFTQQEAKAYAKAGKVVEETISSIRTVVSLNGLEIELGKFGEAVSVARKKGLLKSFFLGLSFGCMSLAQFSSFALAFYIGINWVYDGSLYSGTMITTFFAVMMGSVALGLAGPQFAVLGVAQGAATSVYEVIDRDPEIDSMSPEGKRGDRIRGDIVFEDVHFNYPSRPDVQVLKGLNVRVNRGQTVALVGASGCGKSTVVSLLLRYYDTLGGRILIDGVPINEYNIEYIRQEIAVVSQEPILFNCSIEDNIRYGNLCVTEDQIVNACKMANAEKFIETLPQRYHTLVGDRGTQLSGGQKQRIAIARALVRDPKILLLDEATSALDTESEALVQVALDKEGVVVEEGTHAELMAREGMYHALVTAQTFTDAVDAAGQGRKHSSSESGSLEDKVLRRLSQQVSEISEVQSRMRSVTTLTVNPGEDNQIEKKDDFARLKRELDETGARRSNLIEIVGYAKRHWKWMVLGCSFCLIGGLVYPTYSVFFTQVINVFSLPHDEMKKKGHFWALMFLVLAFTQLITGFSQTFFMGIASENLTSDMRNGLFRNILSQHIGYFDNPLHACGRICTRLATDVPNLRSAIDFRLTVVFTSIISIIAGVSLAFYYGWQMALLIVAILPLFVLGQFLRGRRFSGKSVKSAKDFEESGKIAIEAIENVRTVQALTKEQLFYERFCRRLDGPHREAHKEALIQGLSYGFAASTIFLMNTCAYRLALFLILKKHQMPIQVLRVMYAITISSTTLGFATSYIPEYMKASLAGGIIFKMLGERTNIDNLSKSGRREKLTGDVTFKEVKFAYPERESVEILKGLSFTVRPGETLALVGPSGCGKSTVVALLERFYDVLDGQVLLGDSDIRELNPHFTRSQIALVSQEPILFDCSIRANICYGMEFEASQEQIEAAAKKANIHNFITTLPDRYETRVGDKGTQLSGGQKQRIAIARALIRDPKILLLDEATSALDTESEKIVQDALDNARVGRTCIVIAHRLNTIMNADSIAVVQQGKIVEQGTHAELVAQKGAYYELTKKQIKHKDNENEDKAAY